MLFAQHISKNLSSLNNLKRINFKNSEYDLKKHREDFVAYFQDRSSKIFFSRVLISL